MLIITLENKAEGKVEFNKMDELSLVKCLLDSHSSSASVDAVTEKVVGVFTLLRCQYRFDVETAYSVAVGSLDCCLLAGDCPTKTSLQHYRNEYGEL